MTRVRRKGLDRRTIPPLDEILVLALVHGKMLNVLFAGDLDRVRLAWETYRDEILAVDPEPWALRYFELGEKD